jgi:hypothetical protein
MTPFIIYVRAVGIYCLLTIPALALPFMYLISITYVLIYGCFAWAVFTIIYFIIVFCNPKFIAKMSILFIGVVAAVTLSFQMIEVLKAEDNVWHSGAFLLFPLAAVVSGWISLYVSREKIKAANRNLLLSIPGSTTS